MLRYPTLRDFPSFLTTGETTLERLTSYLEKINSSKENPLKFRTEIQQIYAQEKKHSPINKKKNDLRTPIDLQRRGHHLNIHSIIGNVFYGTSDTVSIPYLDQQGYNLGLEYQINNFAQQYPEIIKIKDLNLLENKYADLVLQNQMIEKNLKTATLTHVYTIAKGLLLYKTPQKLHDVLMQNLYIENINLLRRMLTILIPEYLDAHQSQATIEFNLQKQHQTRSNIDALKTIALRSSSDRAQIYHQVIIAKIKHLMYLSDLITDKKSRLYLLTEIKQYIDQSKISPNLLTINMGIDGGMSNETYRPPYDHTSQVQFDHLRNVPGFPAVQSNFIQLLSQYCIAWDWSLWEASMQRSTNHPTLLTEPAEYMHPWGFQN